MHSPESADRVSPSLYDRLGGVYNIAAIAEDFIDRILADPLLNANPRVRDAHHRVPPAGFKFLVTQLLCALSGGPQHYTGRSMGDAHRHLIVTGEEWQAFMGDFRQSLLALDVPDAEQRELEAIFESTKDEIVIAALHA